MHVHNRVLACMCALYTCVFHRDVEHGLAAPAAQVACVSGIILFCARFFLLLKRACITKLPCTDPWLCPQGGGGRASMPGVLCAPTLLQASGASVNANANERERVKGFPLWHRG